MEIKLSIEQPNIKSLNKDNISMPNPVKVKESVLSLHSLELSIGEKLNIASLNISKIKTEIVNFGFDNKLEIDNKLIFEGKSLGTCNVFANQKTVDDCFSTITNYPELKDNGFAHQHVLPKGVDNKFNIKDFYNLMEAYSPPNISGGGNKYEQIVGAKLPDGKSYIDKFRDNLLKSDKKNLTPSDVIKLSLDATNGDYGLASLTAHNFLKNITYRGRQEGVKSLSKDEITIISKLGNLRQSDSNDKLGPWYHFFGVQTALAVTKSPIAVHSMVDIEHGIRDTTSQKIIKEVSSLANKLGINIKPAISQKDPEKANIDNYSIKLADKIFKNSLFNSQSEY
ncbi:MAG: hypothetical protein H7263_12105 [Candidatus Sericytochromatia bacterium]|nr:hypothetical protein [Candidatus Sericytochromatia bacterium]